MIDIKEITLNLEKDELQPSKIYKEENSNFINDKTENVKEYIEQIPKEQLTEEQK